MDNSTFEHTNEENPTDVLQAAVEKLEIFIQPEVGSLELHPNGHLIATKSKPLDRVIGLARHFIVPIFSDQARQEREKKLSQIKQEVLRARDIIQSHSSLIDKLKSGEPNQQKLAESALNAIKRYNAFVERDYSSWTTKYDFYNFERNRILLDEEIKGQTIELPHMVSIKFESHLSTHPAQKSLRELSAAFIEKSENRGYTHLSPTHKKSNQFIFDTFRMKAVRMIQLHLSQHHSMAEIINLVKQTPIESIEEGTGEEHITMQQVVEEVPGNRIVLTGCFKRPTVDSKFMSMPILVDFHLSSYVEHAGFPYPSQYNGWALSEKLVESFPLRCEQVPLFQQIDQKRKRLAQALLFDQTFIQRSKRLFKLKREAFDKDKETFLILHQKLQEAILNACGEDNHESAEILAHFYELVKAAPSAFDLLNAVQEKLNALLVKEPAKKLEEGWLEATGSLLRKGSAQEKLQHAAQLLNEDRATYLADLNLEKSINAYIHLMGNVIGSASQGIILQYFSEKIGFAPPMLDDFEQKIQAAAFQQLSDFLTEFEERVEIVSIVKIKEEMIRLYQQNIALFNLETIEDHMHISSKIVQELEIYFPSRFFARYPRKSYLPNPI